jgi:hypothetical protein
MNKLDELLTAVGKRSLTIGRTVHGKHYVRACKIFAQNKKGSLLYRKIDGFDFEDDTLEGAIDAALAHLRGGT